MKKTLIMFSMALLIATSLVAGTLAVYNVNLGTIATGSVVAKRFELIGAGNQNFSDEVKIAPTETVTKVFTVDNFKGVNVTETPMELNITVTVAASDNKEIIEPVQVTVYKVKGSERVKVGETVTGAGTITFKDGFAVTSAGQTYTYEVVANWPSGSTDTTFQGDGHGNKITVDVNGTQVSQEDINAAGLIK